MTLAGIVADLRAGQPIQVIVRRLITVVTMAVGAIVGASLVLHAAPWMALALAAVVAASVCLGLAIVARPDQVWRRP